MSAKKELKAAYKALKFQAGVFRIRNTVNDKIFIDSSGNIPAKCNRHKMQLNFGVHPVPALQQDWQTFGEAVFVFEVLAELEQKEEEQKDYTHEAAELLELYVAELQPYGEKGYHIH